MCKQTIFVVRDLRRNLMGLPAITSLDVARQIGETIVASNVKEHFPKMFDGLGNLGEEYLIKLKGDAVPYSLFTPRNVAIPVREKVREELIRMEALGVVSKVTQPTAWCAGMVVVPKRSGDVRICVDLKPLNECVLREVYPIPKWTILWRNYQVHPSLVNSTQIADSGKYPWLTSPSILRLS